MENQDRQKEVQIKFQKHFEIHSKTPTSAIIYLIKKIFYNVKIQHNKKKIKFLGRNKKNRTK